jgi:hypothetical protein
MRSCYKYYYIWTNRQVKGTQFVSLEKDQSVNLRRAWRYHRGNYKPQIKEGQTIQCPKEKGQKNKQ